MQLGKKFPALCRQANWFLMRLSLSWLRSVLPTDAVIEELAGLIDRDPGVLLRGRSDGGAR